MNMAVQMERAKMPGIAFQEASIDIWDKKYRLKSESGEVIDEKMDLPFMAEKAAGRFWKDFSEMDRARWVAAFRGNTVANYAGRFNRFSGQSFVTHGEEPAPFDTVLVKTTLKDPGGEDLQLNYLKKESGRWRIIDIFMHGTVSELALRRAEYSSALERDGLDKVVQSLEGQADKLSSGAGGQ